MMPLRVVLVVFMAAGALAYLPHDAGPKEHFISDAFLRDIVESMGKDLAETADSYLEFPGSDPRLSLMSRATKDLESEQFDYDSLPDGNPNPTLRDQEYLQHSTLWGQYLNGDGNKGSGDRVRPGPAGAPSTHLKPDAALPAYCNPPNPCPVGYTEEHGCMTNFRNTAAFSREYQAGQECMCDGEHMFECPTGSSDGGSRVDSPSARLDRFLAQQMQLDEHKNLVAKKFHSKKSINPYLEGEKLPVAAKKGINVDFPI